MKKLIITLLFILSANACYSQIWNPPRNFESEYYSRLLNVTANFYNATDDLTLKLLLVDSYLEYGSSAVSDIREQLADNKLDTYTAIKLAEYLDIIDQAKIHGYLYFRAYVDCLNSWSVEDRSGGWEQIIQPKQNSTCTKEQFYNLLSKIEVQLLLGKEKRKEIASIIKTKLLAQYK